MKTFFLFLALAGISNICMLQAEIKKAFADIQPTQGNHVEGRVVFEKEEGGVRVIAKLKGLKPGLHGFHIHEKGDCSAADGSSAGGHYNPTNQPHGGPDDQRRHIGDLGNIIGDIKGNAVYERIDRFITLEGPNSIIGRSIVVHADPDDFTTQPTGNSGGRLGCGVIQEMKLSQ